VSLGIVIKGPEGLVLAADSRVTLSAQTPQGLLRVNFDNATKLLSFKEPHNFVGAVTYGQAAIDLRTAYSFLPEFEAGLLSKRLPVQEFAKKLSDFFMKQWEEIKPDNYSGPDMTFVVGGFDEDDPYGRVFLIETPRNPEPIEKNPHPEFGMTWGGQHEFVDRLIQGYDPRALVLLSNILKLQPEQIRSLEESLKKSLSMPIPLPAMPLQDCVDLAIFFIRTTIDAQNLTVGIRGTGGPIDVAIITRRDGLEFIQRKRIAGETGTSR
jgi:hypothetical protein